MMTLNEEKAFDELIDLELLKEVFHHQAILDSEFLKVANRQPELQDRADAAFDEMAEFIAEFKTINKYWTNKATNYAAIIDEHSDIIHFTVGYYLASLATPEDLLNHLRVNYELLLIEHDRAVDSAAPLWESARFYLRKMRRTDSFVEGLAAATILVGMCEFSKLDVLVQYRYKRDENYRRIARTAKGENDR